MPFTVITLKKVPAYLRGDLTKWMQEIAPGVYVGNFNTKVREKIWQRVKENVSSVEATMSYAFRNEIGYNFKTLNTNRQVIDYEGIPLVRVNDQTQASHMNLGFSSAYKMRQARKFQAHKSSKVAKLHSAYVVLDIETDGLQFKVNQIIELGAVKVKNGERTSFNQLINHDRELPSHIKELTGITEEMLRKEGVNLEEALKKLFEFIGDLPIIGYNINFDINFINYNLIQLNHNPLHNKTYDVMSYVKREKLFLKNYKLETVLASYNIEDRVPHRALKDAELIDKLINEVNKLRDLFGNQG